MAREAYTRANPENKKDIATDFIWWSDLRATFEIDIERKKIVTNLFSKATWDLTDERNTQFTNDTFVFMHLMIYLFERIEFPIRQIYILFETET